MNDLTKEASVFDTQNKLKALNALIIVVFGLAFSSLLISSMVRLRISMEATSTIMDKLL